MSIIDRLFKLFRKEAGSASSGNAPRGSITEARREALLGTLQAKMGGVDVNAYDVGRCLREYVGEETDPDVLRAVVSKTIDEGFRGDAGNLAAVFSELFVKPSSLPQAAKLVIATHYLQSYGSIHGKSAQTGGSTGSIRECVRNFSSFVRQADPGIARFIIADAPGFLRKDRNSSLTAEERVGFYRKLVDFDAEPGNADPINKFAAEGLILEAQEIQDDPDRRLDCYGVALRYAANPALENEARYLVLQEISKADDCASIAGIVRGTAFLGHPDQEIDSAGAEKWKAVVARQSSRDERLAAALDVAEEVTGTHRVGSLKGGTLMSAACDVIRDIAREDVKVGRYDGTIRTALEGIKSKGLDAGEAAQILVGFPLPAGHTSSGVPLQDFLAQTKPHGPQ